MKEILIIEDDLVMQHLLRNLFTEKGYKINSIMDGKDIVENEHLTSANIIILDMMIPHVYEGADLINCYKDIKSPIIVVSSIDEEDGLYFCKKINAQAFFNKPFNPQLLLQKVEELLGSD